MNFIINIFKGIAIGSGAIIPGVSSGVLCVILGIYEKLLDSVLYLFKDFKKNISFLLPIVLGCIIGVFLFSNALNYLLYAFPIQTKSIFIGLIIGGLPQLFREMHKREKFKIKYIFFLIASFLIGIITVIAENTINISNVSDFSIFYLILCGFFMSIGVIVPGVSSTIILMLFKVYPIYLSSISNLYLPVLIPMGIGLIIGGLIFMNLTKFLLDNFRLQTFYTIIGFTIGSIFILMPEVDSIIKLVVSILCIFVGYLVATTLCKNNE